jgi:hypothetical protein
MQCPGSAADVYCAAMLCSKGVGHFGSSCQRNMHRDLGLHLMHCIAAHSEDNWQELGERVTLRAGFQAYEARQSPSKVVRTYRVQDLHGGVVRWCINE